LEIAPSMLVAHGSLDRPRADHTATLLDSGDLLLVGGTTYASSNPNRDFTLSTADIVRGANLAARWLPPLASRRIGHTASLLPSGRVLIVGGISTPDGWDPSSMPELFDPAIGEFVPSDDRLAHRRSGHAAAPLSLGEVLIVGGDSGQNTAEIYNST